MTNETLKRVAVGIWFPLFLAIYEVAIYLSNDAYLPAMPDLARDLSTSHQMIQLTLTAWFLGSGALQLFIGPITDRIGRRPVLLWGGIIFTLATIICAITNNITVLLIMRFLQGASVATMYVPGYATIHELYDQKQAIHILAIMSSITILAPAFGPLLGALVLFVLDWRWIFGLLAIMAVVVLVGLWRKMPETLAANPEKVPFKTILRQYKNILTNKSFILSLLKAQCFFSAMIAWIVAGPFLMIEKFQLSSLDFSIAQGIIFGGFILSTRLVKHLMHKLSLDKIVNSAIILLVVGSTYALATAFLWPNLMWNTIIAMLVLGCATGLAFPILNRLAIEASNEPMGSRVAVLSCLLGLGSTLTSAVISLLPNSLLSLAIVLLVLSLLTLLFRALK